MSDEEHVSADEMVGLLSQTVGHEKAQSALRETARELGLEMSQGLTRAEALKVLEQLAEGSDIVGVTARFAKSRLLLRGPKAS